MLHRLGTAAIGDASKNAVLGQVGSAGGQDASQIFEQALSIFQQAIDLPPNDLESRVVIARAYSRLGFIRWMLAMAKRPRTANRAPATFPGPG